MPALNGSVAILAGATLIALDNWQYQYAPYPALFELFQNATAVGLLVTITSGSDTIMEEAPVSAGGVAGVIPPRLTVEPITDKVDRGDFLKVRVRNPTGGTVTYNFMAIITPISG